MRLASLTCVSIASILLLTGCTQLGSASSEPAASEATPVPSPTPTIDPGPVELTKEEAGVRYLSLVCQRNALSAQLNDAFVAQEETFFNGGDPDVTAVKAAAAEAMRVSRLSVELLDDPYYTWPEGLSTHLQAIRDAQVGESGMFSDIANATRYEDAYYMTSPGPSSGSAAQEIRYQLGLPVDTTASCVGYETATDTLHAQMIERNEYLASFTDEE